MLTLPLPTAGLGDPGSRVTDSATGPCCLSRVWAGCLAWLSVLSLGVSLEGIAAFRVALGALWGCHWS